MNELTKKSDLRVSALLLTTLGIERTLISYSFHLHQIVGELSKMKMYKALCKLYVSAPRITSL